MAALRFALALIVACFIVASASGRDGGQWAQYQSENPGLSNWYARQRQPDQDISCCGPADAYWADEFEVVDGEFYAIITDTRPDEPLQRPHIPPGTRVLIPPQKHNDPRKDPNPTLHAIVFVVLQPQGYWPFCYFNLPGDG